MDTQVEVPPEEAQAVAEDEPTGGAASLEFAAAQTTADLQRRLAEFGWPIAADGAYGPSTFAAVRDFQRGFAWWRLLVDGHAGPKTWEALEYTHAHDGRCSPNFRFREFASHGDRWIKVDRELVHGLELYRELLGHGLTIISGYRDPLYNNTHGGARNSQHLYGNAADLPTDIAYPVVKKLRCFSGIGIQAANNFVRHVDVRHRGPNTTGGTVDSPTIWYYR